MLKLLFLSNKYDDCKVEGHEKLRLFVIYRQDFRQEIPLREDHNYAIFMFLGRQESYSHICIITGKVSVQDLDGFF